ncbi:flagellar biosynthetic protein FliO [Sinomonas sp. ASV322]|uniref:flagellar biosynthetic protein FliO n=1 Tax=Sinomonas sp. ASV322 TaxID=3041920 RepID=UPI0027DE0D14|nr:flagellar biosynthetic protein FliO [Sinomonas sp. ASV322]MDQ4504124.1 flagellar biosynthetic protein FliO [Sinomonas sp. ASV322]
MDSLLLGLRVLVSLAAVLGLMWLLHRRLRRGAAPARAKALAVVSRQAVGSKASVVLVEADGRRFLLGVTEHGISVLHTAEAPSPCDAPDFAGAATAPETRATAVLPLPTASGRRAARLAEGGAAAFGDALDTELERQPRVQQPMAGSILDLGTWRQAADALRTGRRK